MRVHNKVGNLIDFYNVRFYHQGKSKYDQYLTLFYLSGSPKEIGTSVRELILRGIPAQKIIIGKTLSQADNGFMACSILGSYVSQGLEFLKWRGMMLNDYSKDANGKFIMDSASNLVD